VAIHEQYGFFSGLSVDASISLEMACGGEFSSIMGRLTNGVGRFVGRAVYVSTLVVNPDAKTMGINHKSIFSISRA